MTRAAVIAATLFSRTRNLYTSLRAIGHNFSPLDREARGIPLAPASMCRSIKFNGSPVALFEKSCLTEWGFCFLKILCIAIDFRQTAASVIYQVEAKLPARILAPKIKLPSTRCSKNTPGTSLDTLVLRARSASQQTLGLHPLTQIPSPRVAGEQLEPCEVVNRIFWEQDEIVSGQGLGCSETGGIE